MSRLAWITAAVLLMPAPAVAQIVFDDSPPPAVPAKGAKAKSDVDKVICRSQDEIGSRLKTHQVCLTLDQWRTYELNVQQQASELQAKAAAPASR